MDARPLILGTAGHIDHGKTSLIKALTGIDADRLPEERARGMTIDLGFAHLEVGGRRIGVIDVPGHERFVRNMVAGATGIDFVLLVIAADDAVMPQTREHLEIIDLLGVAGGSIALNKIDLVDARAADAAESAARRLVEGTALEGCPIVRVSAATGEGMAELRAAIEAQASRLNWAERPSLFRLPIDRCFTIQGHGTIVTGSLMGGEIAAQEEVELMPQRRRVRVRRAESHGEGRDEDNLSRRVALNLPGIKTREIRRGMELAAPGYLRPTTRLAVELRCLRDAPLVIDGERAHRLHIGTEDVDARFALIGVAELEPGARCFAIAQTQREICATHGQRFIVRSPSHGVTIGGGRVVATAPPKVRLGSAPEWMNAWANGGETERILAALEIEPTLGADPVGLHRETGVSPERSGPLLEGLADSGRIRRSPGGKGAGFWTADYIDRAKSGLIGRIQAMLEAAYPRASLDRGALLKGTASLGPNEFVLGLIEQLKSESKVREREGRYYLEGFQVRLRDAELEEQNRLIDVYAKARFAPPKLEEAIARLGLSRDKAAPLYRHAVETGALIELNGEIALHRDVHDALLESLRGELAPGRGLTVSEIKQIIGVSRKFAVPICEHLDRKGFTRRQGDLRFAGEKLAAKAETETAR